MKSELAFFRQLNKICIEVARGKREAEKKLDAFTNEKKYPKVITELAESFGWMLAKIQIREAELEETIALLQQARAALKKENKELKSKINLMEIEIDHVKKQHEVEKITETPFFKKIQSRKKRRR